MTQAPVGSRHPLGPGSIAGISAAPTGENPVTVLLVLTALAAAVSVGLFIEMYRRDEPALGVAGLTGLMVAAVLSMVHGAMAST